MTGIPALRGITLDMRSPTLLELYMQRTPRSAELAAQARELLPGGVAHDSRLLDPHGIYVTRAAGSRKWDVDGHEYVDYSGGHGALLLGHNHPAVSSAVARQLERGTHYGACHDLEIRWAETIQHLMPSAERVRFTSSGTEATLLALRVARAATGRTKVLRFAGHFHGWHDHVASGYGSHFDGSATPGVLEAVAEEMLIVPPGDVAAMESALDAHACAAAIIEPTGASWGQVPLDPEFLFALRDATARRGVALIFDEVISGFRCSPGGAQGVLGIQPDLTTLAKIVAGGLPGAAVVGRAALMDELDPAAAQRLGREKIAHHGTFNANPLSAAAGIAALEIIATTDACERASEYAAQLRNALNDVIAEETIDWSVYGTFSGFHIFTNPNHLPIRPHDIDACRISYEVLKAKRPAVITALRLGMLVHGVELFGWPGGPTSTVHTERDLQQTAEAFRNTIRAMKQEGLIEA
jgi:glutamate-1-semialdehyde 2,1-aminomutase